MTDIIIHHYPASPVSEKIRAAMGLKKLSWHSVEQNRLPDRPELMAMTGGYRRIPVMQVGADIYCDTQLILMELEVRHPSPTLFPGGGTGMPFALSRWTDGPLFDLAVRMAFAPNADKLPPELVADRSRLYFGPNGDMGFEKQDLPHTLAQVRVQLGWLEERLASGREFLLGNQAGMPDLLAWYIVWFISDRYEHAESLLAEFPALLAWAEKMKAVGHGQVDSMTPAQALQIARQAQPQTAALTDPLDPQNLAPGLAVSVVPLADSGETPVAGNVQAVSRTRIALRRNHPDCGDVVVHFPRAGYRVQITS